MLSRRAFTINLLSLFGGMVLAAQPWSVSLDGGSPSVTKSSAAAAPGKGGPGKGGPGGKGGKGPGGGKNAGANGKGVGKSKGSGKSKAKGSAKAPAATFDVRHADGTSERIRKDRYIMKDAKGRTIIDRPAKRPDRIRLERFAEPPRQ